MAVPPITLEQDVTLRAIDESVDDVIELPFEAIRSATGRLRGAGRFDAQRLRRVLRELEALGLVTRRQCWEQPLDPGRRRKRTADAYRLTTEGERRVAQTRRHLASSERRRHAKRQARAVA